MMNIRAKKGEFLLYHIFSLSAYPGTLYSSSLCENSSGLNIFGVIGNIVSIVNLNASSGQNNA